MRREDNYTAGKEFECHVAASPQTKRQAKTGKSQRTERLRSHARYWLAFLILFLTVGITVGRELLASLNIDTNYLLITLIAITVALLTAHRRVLLILLVVGLSLSVNLPLELLHAVGVSRDVLFGTLLMLVFFPLLGRLVR